MMTKFCFTLINAYETCIFVAGEVTVAMCHQDNVGSLMSLGRSVLVW